MKVRVLGTAAGGGWPQWNCACEQCGHARRDGVERSQDCVAVSGDGHSWYLLNASPDLRSQLLRAPELAPGPGERETPLRGVLLTDAELDHVLGLFTLREAASLEIYGTQTILGALATALPVRQIVDPYGQGWHWHEVAPGRSVELAGGLIVTPFVLGGKRPRYASGCEGSDWVLGYRIGTLLYAPCFGEWTLDDALDGVTVALIDGTFLTRDEMPHVTGHLPISDSQKHLGRHPQVRFRYTHLNNTNPLLSRERGIPLAAEMELL